MARRMVTTLKIIQQNVLKWTFQRRNELTNLYLQMNPDVILLNSTGVKENEKIKIFNYNVYQKNKLNEDNAGVAIAIKRELIHQVLDDYEEDVLAVKIDTTKGPIIVSTTYRPPRVIDFPLADILKLLRTNMPVYILGDFNARHRTLGHNDTNDAGIIINNLLERDLAVCMGPDFSTRVGHRGLSKPDIILRNNQAFLNYAITEGELTTSDHIPILFTVSTAAIVKQATRKKQYSKTNWELFKLMTERDMERINREKNLQDNPRNINREAIDKELQDWFKVITDNLNATTPNRTISYIPHPRESDLLKALHLAYQQVKNYIYCTPEIRQQILFLQEEIKNENKRLFDENWDELIRKMEIDKKDPRKFWETMRKLMGGRGNTVPAYVYDQNGRKITQDEEKLRRFKDIWVDVFKISNEENENFDAENEQMVTNYLEENRYRTVPYQWANINRLDANNPITKPLTYTQMLLIINQFKNKAPGASGITKKILLQLPRMALQRLNNIINLLLSMGYFSTILKNGHMIMTPKSDKDPRNVINYRPITLLEIPAKILEKTVNERFYTFLEDNNLLHKNQFGFRKKYGTEVAITKIYETIALNQRYGGQCNIVCRDVAKAFDKVWHAGLKYKILQLQLPDIAEKMLCSFLDQRTAQIRLNNFLSDKIPLASGVPQGSILSPTMYVFYTSDLPLPGAGGTDVLFADDITQVVEYMGPSKRMLALRTTREIERVNEYERRWKIQTNKSKFKILSISKTRPERIIIDHRQINFAYNVSILGFTLGRTGFKTHTTKRLAIARGTMTKLKRFRKLRPRTKSHLYKTLARSALEYPNTPMCVMSFTNRNKLQKFQNGIIRRYINTGDNEDQESIEELHVKFNMEPINKRMHRRAVKNWERFASIDEEMSNRSMEANRDNTARDHYWWRRIAPYVEEEEPEAIY